MYVTMNIYSYYYLQFMIIFKNYFFVQLMVDGQTGRLEIVQCIVLKRKPEIVTILHHLVGERIAVAQQ